ncbi:MAG: glycosyltransferase family 39 protein [Bdellovibrionota bacterium]
MSSNKKSLLIVSILGLHVLLCFWFSPQILHSDDLSYSKAAYSILTSSFESSENLTSTRLGLTIPTAIAYRLLGVNNYSTIIFPFLCSLTLIYLVYLVGSQISTTTGIYAALLLAVNIEQIKNALNLTPDLPAACMMFIAAVSLYFKVGKTQKVQVGLALIFCLALFWAFLLKETIIYTAPFFSLMFIADIFKNRERKFWYFSIGLLFLLLVGYFITYTLLTGDPFIRFKSLALGQENWTRPIPESISTLLPRLSYKPLSLLLSISYGFLFCLALPTLFFPKKITESSTEKIRYWSLYLFSIFVCLWFGSVSLSSYHPTPLFKRYWIYLSAPLSILAAVYLARLSHSKIKLSNLVQLPVVCSLLAAIIFYNLTLFKYYFLFQLLIILSLIILYESQLLRKILVFPPSILALTFIYFSYPTVSQIEQEIFTNFLMSTKRKTLVITDQRLVKTQPFYWGYAAKTNPAFVSYESYRDQLGNAYQDIYVLINWRKSQYLAQQYGGVGIDELSLRYKCWDLILEKNNQFGEIVGLYKLKQLEDFNIKCSI